MKNTWRRENHVNLKLRPYISYSNKLRKYFKTLRLSHVFFNKRSSISLYYLGQLCDILTRLLARLTAPPSFSSPEPTILLACGRNRELWEQPFWNNKGNNRILPIRQRLPIRFNSAFIYGACPKWLLPELSIPAAGQKDRRLWGQEWPRAMFAVRDENKTFHSNRKHRQTEIRPTSSLRNVICPQQFQSTNRPFLKGTT